MNEMDAKQDDDGTMWDAESRICGGMVKGAGIMRTNVFMTLWEINQVQSKKALVLTCVYHDTRTHATHLTYP